jgi:hypothetical protein
MNAIEEIIAKLQKYPDAKYQIGSDYIRVFPGSENGFQVKLIAAKNRYTVHFNGWHETFASEVEALNCFAFGLSTECRLKECRRGRMAYQWAVEYKKESAGLKTAQRGCFFMGFGAGPKSDSCRTI